ncbi:hypothetical protein AB1283_04685 [Bacillus sp. S13(2024)]|uniref:hypothetical protein n=1 Tax=unclassified Bacillus (in: firmicutes) TaxID=185979 RepID=UPI003D1D3D68
MMNYFSIISDLVFIDRKHLFTETDIMLYHPGHFPELNELVAKHCSQEVVKYIFIPSIFNTFLQANEFEYHREILIQLGVPYENIQPITGDFSNVESVIKSAFNMINNQEITNVLLAGKSFFCRRFLLLASLYAAENKILDVLPLQDLRQINRDTWHTSEKGRQRITNEIKQYHEITEKHSLLFTRNFNT